MFSIFHFIWLGICAVFMAALFTAAAVLVAIVYIPIFIRGRRTSRK